MSSFVQLLFMVFILFRAKQKYGCRAVVTSDFSRDSTATCRLLLRVGCVLFSLNRSMRPPPVYLPLVACHKQAQQPRVGMLGLWGSETRRQQLYATIYFRPMVFDLFCSHTARRNFSRTLYARSCWYTIQVMHGL
jgi:hypothetical protein